MRPQAVTCRWVGEGLQGVDCTHILGSRWLATDICVGRQAGLWGSVQPLLEPHSHSSSSRMVGGVV